MTARQRNADSDAFAQGEPVAYGPLVGVPGYMLGWSLESTPACNGPRDTRPEDRRGALRARLETGEIVDLDCDNFTPLRRFDQSEWGKHLSAALARALRQGNPLVPGPPPRYVMGGMGTPPVWEYKGREIQLRPGREQDYEALWMDVDPDAPEEGPRREVTWGRDEQEALANARHKIDLLQKYAEYPSRYFSAEQVVHHVLDYMHDHTKLKPTRANVARQIQEVATAVKRHGAFEFQHRGETRRLQVDRREVDAFDSLPLAERTKLIEEVIDFQVRGNFWEPQRLPNPIRRRIEELQRKANLLAYNPVPPKTFPVIKRGHVPQMILGTVGRKGVYRYGGWELEVLKNVAPELAPTLWDVNITGPRGQEYFGSSNEGYDGALCHGKIAVDLVKTGSSLQPAQRNYLYTTWADIATIAQQEARRGRQPTRAAVARAIAAGRRQAGEAGQSPRWQWFDALPLGDRVQLIDDRLEQLRCTYGDDLRNWP